MWSILLAFGLDDTLRSSTNTRLAILGHSVEMDYDSAAAELCDGRARRLAATNGLDSHDRTRLVWAMLDAYFGSCRQSSLR